MSNKLLCLISLVLLLGLAGSAAANSFTGEGTTVNLWNDPCNWSQGVPTWDGSNKWCNMDVDGTLCIIDSTHSAPDANAIAMGAYVGAPGVNEWHITGGNLTTAYLNVTRGPSDSGAFGYLKMTGGHVAAAYFKIPEQFIATSGMVSGHCDLYGGTVHIKNLTLSGAPGGHGLHLGTREEGVYEGGIGTLNIRKGTMIIDDTAGLRADQLADIQQWVADDWITSYEGRGTVVVSYVQGDPNTIVLTATVPYPQPTNGEINVVLQPELMWAAAAGDYDVYLGTVGNLALVSSHQSAPEYTPATALLPNTSYEWRIDTYPGPVTGPVWTFTTMDIASNPSPVNNAFNQMAWLTLSWTPASGAEAHDVYLGTTSLLVSNRDASTYLGRVTDPTIDPEPDPDWGKQYYWAVDEVFGGVPATGTGTTWKFRTKSLTCGIGPAYGDTNSDCRVTLEDYANMMRKWNKCGWNRNRECPEWSTPLIPEP